MENFSTLIVVKISWLVTRFIFELIGVGAVPDLNEPQAFKSFFLQMIVC